MSQLTTLKGKYWNNELKTYYAYFILFYYILNDNSDIQSPEERSVFLIVLSIFRPPARDNQGFDPPV